MRDVAFTAEEYCKDNNMPMERFDAMQKDLKMDIFRKCERLSKTLQKDELIHVTWSFGGQPQPKKFCDWYIVLTNKRVFIRLRERQAGGFWSKQKENECIWEEYYRNVSTAATISWAGDLGAHAEGGGGYIIGGDWGIWGSQQSPQIVRHHMGCTIRMGRIYFQISPIYSPEMVDGLNRFVRDINTFIDRTWRE
nr:hypothetical protein [Candidatus Njordarchaeota archaeon]